MPFTPQEFIGLFRTYNELVWPAQAGLVLLALLAVIFLCYPTPRRDRIVAGILAFLWAWIAIVYHVGLFTRINNAAWLFGILFLAQACLLLWLGVVKGRLHFRVSRSLASMAGLVLLLYALLVYPALNVLLGHAWPTMPTFGLPCPVTLFTLGMLLLTTPPAPTAAFIIPLVWAAIGSTAAYLFGIFEDLGLLAAGLACIVLLFRNRHRPIPR